MKKFSKLLALSLATALVFGMTVSAAPSPVTSDGDIAVEYDGEAPEGATKFVADEGAAAAPAKDDANKAIASENSNYEMVNVIENWLNESREEEEGNNGTASNDGMLN